MQVDVVDQAILERCGGVGAWGNVSSQLGGGGGFRGPPREFFQKTVANGPLHSETISADCVFISFFYRKSLFAIKARWGVRKTDLKWGKQHLPKARVESCSAATTLALYVKNFPGWPTLFPSHWGRPIRELAYTVTYYFDTMNDLNMYAIYLPELNGLRGRMDKTLAFWSRDRKFNPRPRQLFFLSVIWRNYYFLFF